MSAFSKNIYVIGTGLSHDGSVCLLKNGKICFAIEKERITRNKHEGGNDSDAIHYCLKAEGITLQDVDLVVQNANFGSFEFGNSYYKGPRVFNDGSNAPKIVTISHHLANAYYALAACPYEETSILVLDGCGSLYDECIDLGAGIVFPKELPDDIVHLYAEKDSFYTFTGNSMRTVFKDFSPYGYVLKGYPMHPFTTKHSIGGVYAAAADYCFGSMMDTGKLMGLAPYGNADVYRDRIFELKDGRVFVNYDWTRKFNRPARSPQEFWKNFQYYANIAYWVQKEPERAIVYMIRSRRELANTKNLSYTGGVALNAVANAAVLKEKIFENVFFTPAAGDNGLAIGCAYYGWMEVLKKERIPDNGNSCFGKIYSGTQIREELQHFVIPDPRRLNMLVNAFFQDIHKFFNAEKAVNENYLVQFIISGIGVYFVEATRQSLQVAGHGNRVPDCVLYTDAETFINSFRNPGLLGRSIKGHQSFVKGNFDYFLQLTDIGKVLYFFADLISGKKDFPLQFKEEQNVFKAAAKLLAEGNVIGWFQDGSEFGPRAILRNKTYRISDGLLSAVLLTSRLTREQRIRIFRWKQNQVQDNQFDAFINGLGEPYSDMTIRGKRPLLPATEYNQQLAQILKARNYISSFDVKEKGIRVNTFTSEGT